MSYSGLTQSSRWRADNILSQRLISKEIRAWVTDQGSLTAALTRLSDGEFKVKVLSQCIAFPHWHEQRKLNKPLSRAAMIRQVELKVHGQAVIYARSIIPLSLAVQGPNGLANLGRTPLGHLLFKDGKIRVSKREFAEFQIASTQSSASTNVQARRTPYDYQGSTILVTELFLPALAKWL